jgi:hypothetical protein
MIQPADQPAPFRRAGQQSSLDPRIPLWRRITALLSLGSLVVVVGVVMAAAVGATALLALFVLERAIRA